MTLTDDTEIKHDDFDAGHRSECLDCRMAYARWRDDLAWMPCVMGGGNSMSNLYCPKQGEAPHRVFGNGQHTHLCLGADLLGADDLEVPCDGDVWEARRDKERQRREEEMMPSPEDFE